MEIQPVCYFIAQVLLFYIRKLITQKLFSKILSFVDCFIKKHFLVFFKKETSSERKQLLCFLLAIGKKPLQLRSHLVNSIESNFKFWKLKNIFQSSGKLCCFSVIKTTLTLFINAGIVIARLLIIVKDAGTILLQLQSTWMFLISLEGIMKVSMNYLL